MAKWVKWMELGMWQSIILAGFALLIVLPGGSVSVGTPGDDNGSMDEDPYWEADPGWCGIMTQSDVDEGDWGTGVTFYEVHYRTSGFDNFNKYLLEMTIPWIGIQMTGENMVRYNHSEDSSDNQLYLTLCDYDCYEVGHLYTSLAVDYDLDFDSDSNIEWSFYEYIEFQPPAGGANGWCKIEFQITSFPVWNNQWGHNGNTVQKIDIPFFIDPDVYDNSANDFYSGSVGNWVQVTQEASVQGANVCAQIRYDLGSPSHLVTLTPIPQGANPTSQTLTFLHNMGNEYAHDPSSYDDNANMVDDNGVVWYVESYNVQNTLPPNLNAGTTTGIKCEDFTA